MSFISYAQNYEDVILWRALKHIKSGFYIDIGASDPVDDSVTKSFYDAGWRGVNIEPVPGYFNLICQDRPSDINLQVAIGDGVGVIKIFDVPSIRGWGTSSENIAQKYKEKGLDIDTIEVPEMTLAGICSEYIGQRDIHFLKIDVEGMEMSVLKGMNFTTWRPWIILVEALDPETNSWREDIDRFLDLAGYRKVYFDGLNYYYIAEEHKELESAFSTPPNVFDDFIKYREVVAKNKNEELLKELTEQKLQLQDIRSNIDIIQNELNYVQGDRDHLRNELNYTRMERDRLQTEFENFKIHYQNALREIDRLRNEHDLEVAELTDLRFALRAVYSSTSWKIAAPIRLLKTILTEIFRYPWRLFKAVIKKLGYYLNQYPIIKGKLVWLLSFSPFLDGIARRLLKRAMDVPVLNPGTNDQTLSSVDASHDIHGLVPTNADLNTLSLREREIYEDLLSIFDKTTTGK